MHPSRVRALFRRLQQANPSPTTELEHKTPFELLAAVMLSAHTTDKSVNTATRILFPIANTPQAILAMGVEGLKPYLKVVGMYNQKSKNLIELCRQLVDKHGGEVPHDREALESLPGVGRKTANIILNMVFGESTIAVDTHIFRVSNRTGLAEGGDPREVEDQLNAVVPDEYKKDAHHWLLLHGRYVCTARLPACPKCIIADLCEYPDKTAPKELPASDAPVAHEKPSGRLQAKIAATAARAEARVKRKGSAGARAAAEPEVARAAAEAEQAGAVRAKGGGRSSSVASAGKRIASVASAGKRTASVASADKRIASVASTGKRIARVASTGRRTARGAPRAATSRSRRG